ncbi:MAG TPA: PIN domain-containing protein [Frateuria sp.]|uniref:PIN domain-containing protein n=1 Tax=Frateuria sp. TaxID=2211372 RepID=UPI002DF6F37D|nr:PIN domain-containing protein [Frateuria sp.]
MAASVPRVVLDTNVCLDLFVFDDPRCAGIRAALREGAVEAVTCAACEDEWREVLCYPQLALEPGARRRASVAFEALVRRLPVTDLAAAVPRCADPDDQKFLVLAACVGARWLLSRDRALLALSRRSLRQCGFAVVAPQEWPAPFGRPDALGYGLSAKPV